jgi:hypothetical protein
MRKCFSRYRGLGDHGDKIGVGAKITKRMIENENYKVPTWLDLLQLEVVLNYLQNVLVLQHQGHLVDVGHVVDINDL